MELCDDAIHCGCSDLFELSQKEKERIAERLQKDSDRLEWLVENGARVCKIFDKWTVWFDEESCSTVCVGFDSWRDAIDEAMRGEQ